MDEKPHKYQHLPIPTYEEATSSRPPSSQSALGPEEISDDAERQGLLRHDDGGIPTTRRSNYAPPTVESERGSLDSLDDIEMESIAEVRREMQEMDMDDSHTLGGGSHRSLLSHRLKRFTNFTSPFSNLRFPSFRRFVPSISLPSIDWDLVSRNRVVIFGRLFGIMLIAAVTYGLIASDVMSLGGKRFGMGPMYTPESVRAFVQDQFMDRAHIEHHIKHVTQFPHVAGTEGSYVLGEWIAALFKEHQLEDVRTERFDAYLNYPRTDGRRVAIVEPAEQVWEARVGENAEDVGVYHTLSATGDVTGHLVYANYGSPDDFRRLGEQGVPVQGAVVLLRYFGSQQDTGLKIKAAELAGAAGCIVFSDPADDGKVLGPVYPDGRFMPDDGIHRASVGLPTWVMGDPLSPGWASTPGDSPRLPLDQSLGLAQIPSLPISWQDASHLLSTLVGHGKKLDDRSWTGEPNTEYWTGDDQSPKINVKNVQDVESRQPVYNVIGRIKGWEQSEQKVIVGNHRDALGLGAASPGSGTAIMLAVVRVFGELRRLSWRPLRTIEFVSWDGGEYNHVGSTEHVEAHEDALRQDAIAYINVGAAVTGEELHAIGSPMLQGSLHHVLGRVAQPNANKTIKEIWDENGITVSPVGAGGDYAAFQHITGTSSLDLAFHGEPFPLNSNYDNLGWFLQFGDPATADLEFSAVLAQVLALLILDLVDTPMLHLDLKFYYDTVQRYLDEFEAEFELRALPSSTKAPPSFNMDPIRAAVNALTDGINQIFAFDNHWHTTVYGSGGMERSAMMVQRAKRNERVMRLESNLLDVGVGDHGTGDRPNGSGGGLVNRTQYKHVITAPKLWGGDGTGDMGNVETWPSIRQWIVAGEWEKASEEVKKVADIIQHAADELRL